MARFIISKKKVLDAYDELKSLGATVSYSQKTNPEVAQVLEESTDCQFSVHFEKSLAKIHDKSRVWYFPQAATKEELEQVYDEGVRRFVIDNTNDLERFSQFIAQKNGTFDLLLRMKLKENTIFTGKYFVFGMDAKTINSLVPELRKNSKIEKLGVHFHRKTQNVSEWSLKEELEETLSEETMNAIDIIDIGGGIPSKYKNTNDRAISEVYNKIKQLGEWLSKQGKQLIIEPGRAISAPAVMLEAEILNIYENNIVVDCSVYNGALDTVIANVKLLVDNELENGRLEQNYTIKGITPASEDILRYSVFLENPKVGDTIRFLNAGAYTYSTDFCDLPKLETVIVD